MVKFYQNTFQKEVKGDGVREILRKTRKSKGYTQQQMAERMNMSREMISALETGRVEIRLSDFVRWFQITDMPQVVQQ